MGPLILPLIGSPCRSVSANQPGQGDVTLEMAAQLRIAQQVPLSGTIKGSQAGLGEVSRLG